MVSLQYQDVVELLGYENRGRRILEILGYSYSKRGMDACRAENPNVGEEVEKIIGETLNKFGRFPKESCDKEIYLKQGVDGTIILCTVAEVSISQTMLVRSPCGSLREAIRSLFREIGTPPYVTLD